FARAATPRGGRLPNPGGPAAQTKRAAATSDRPFPITVDGSAVETALERVSHPEPAGLRRRPLHLLTRPRVAGDAGGPLHRHETSEAHQPDFLTRLQRRRDRGDEGVQRLLGLRLVQSRLVSNLRDQFGLGHKRFSQPNSLFRRGWSWAPPAYALFEFRTRH